MVPPPFVCELCHAYDPVSKNWAAGVAVRLISGDGCRAFLREIPDRIWRTICFVTLGMESDGRCVVTEEELAADMQINRTHVGKRLKELAEWQFNGASLLESSEAGYSLAASPGTLQNSPLPRCGTCSLVRRGPGHYRRTTSPSSAPGRKTSPASPGWREGAAIPG
jgi:biotin operon repressor